MKTSTILIIVFAILVAIGFGVKSLEIQANNKAIFTPSDEIGTGKVLCIHYYTLKEGVDPQEYERFVAEWSTKPELVPGMQGMFMKGEKGPHKGQYIWVGEMKSLYVRNYYWTAEGGSTEAWKAIRNSEPYVQFRNRFNELAEETDWTDYVEIVKK